MLLEKLSELLKKEKWILITFIILCCILTALYLIVFFQPGIKMEGEFLIKHKSEGQVLYKSDSLWGEMKIFRLGHKNVDAMAEIIYELPGNINRYYKVTFANKNNWREGIVQIKDENGDVLFYGTSMYSYPFLLNASGNPYREPHNSSVYFGGGVQKSPFDEEYEISLAQVANIASGYRGNIRGDGKLLFLAAFMILIVTIDFLNPLLLFDLRHVLWANNAEPSDFYIAIQRLGWSVYPIMIIVLLLLSLIP
ncbi:MAG: hypothetical protein J7L77_04840 [Clostridiales bacterium]|nr:hypothetical protein [Clostridiales bacterium]